MLCTAFLEKTSMKTLAKRLYFPVLWVQYPGRLPLPHLVIHHLPTALQSSL